MDLLEIETIKKAKQGEQEALLCLYEKYLPLSHPQIKLAVLSPLLRRFLLQTGMLIPEYRHAYHRECSGSR